jgi:perosamine synthetase
VPEGIVRPWPEIRDDDRSAVLGVLDRGILWGPDGPELTGLQADWAAWLGVRHCLAASSGTAALHMALAAVGAGPGDEVITTALSWTSSGTSILFPNAVPVFVDVEALTGTIDPARIGERITERTRAVLPVHLHGLPADLEPIMTLARARGLAVVEDASQAHGAEYHGAKVGTIGDVGVFSIHASKNFPGGEGGLLVTNDDAIFERAARIWQFGEVLQADGSRDYDAHAVGWNYRTCELSAAFARSQLGRLDETIAAVRANCRHRGRRLAGVAGLRLPPEPADRTHTFWRYTLRLEPEELGLDVPVAEAGQAVRSALRAEGVELYDGDLLIPGMTLFRERAGYGRGCPWTCGHFRGTVSYDPADFPRARDWLDRAVPIVHRTPPNGRELMDCYAEAVRKVLAHLDELL